MSDINLLFAAIRKLREMVAADGMQLAFGDARDFAEYRFRAGRLNGLREAERELVELVDPRSRDLIPNN